MKLPKAKSVRSAGRHEAERALSSGDRPQSIYDNNSYMICIIITIVIVSLIWIDNNCYRMMNWARRKRFPAPITKDDVPNESRKVRKRDRKQKPKRK